ncbi:MAG: DUF664 domain-containing protein [Ktedonobacterales bacterium]|nr:DUF664 domain-containing protein [Ktedonobacterales bacterium]
MDENRALLTTLMDSWRERQHYLIMAITPLTAEQLTLRAAPHLRSVGILVAHLIAARAEWFHDTLGVGDTAFAALKTWDQEPERDAATLVSALEMSLTVIESAITNWTMADLATIVFETEWEGKHYDLPRQWVIWHVLEHDLIAVGEISITLGSQGLPGISV